MPETVEQQTEELGRLERAAEVSGRPEDISHVAARRDPDVQERTSKLWFLSYVAILAVLGLGIFLLDWQNSIFRPETAARIHRWYLLGAMGVVGLLGGAKAVDVYAISRLAALSLCLERGQIFDRL